MLPEILFLACALILLYTYFGYILLIQLLGAIRPSMPKNRNSWTPTVSFIIAARNEEKHIQQKLQNTLNLDYPAEKLEIIIASDASDDDTETIAAKYSDRGVKVVRLQKRAGKTAAQNAAVRQASGEILIFSDATTHYRPDVLRRLLEMFDPEGQVGCVCGHLTYQEDADERYEEQRYYWNREVNLRIMESRLGFIPGVAGCIYAVRKSAYVFLEPYAVSDFLQPLAIGYRDLRVIYQPAAVAIEQRSPDLITDFHRRRRTIARALNGLVRNTHYINPFKNKFRAIQIFSHKVLRWFSPFFLILLVITAQYLDLPGLGLALLTLLCILILTGIVGIAVRNYPLGRWLRAPAFFLLANVSSILAVWDWLRGEQYVTWEPQR